MTDNCIPNRYAELVACNAGTLFNVMRPNYNQVDNTPVLVAQSKYLCEPQSGATAEPHYRNVAYYTIFGDRSILLPGDILIKTVPDFNMTPPMTIAHYMDSKELVGYRSARIGMLTNQINQAPLYTTVYFDFLDIGFPGSSINNRLEDSMKIPHTRVIIFKRENLIRLRTQLVETDWTNTIMKDGVPVPFQRKWLVEEIDTTGNFMVLTLRHNDN